MNKSNRVMVVLAIAMIIMLGMVNLHCLYQSARKRTSVQKITGKSEALDLSIHLGLLPSVYLNIVFDNH
jgi:hypothetical protein